jgi:hypothetical protein
MSDSNSTITCSSFSASSERKKRKYNFKSASVSAVSDNERLAERSNKSHTSYFFRKDTTDNQIAFCIICEQDTNKKPYPYSRKGVSTSNLSCHLRDKHGITRYNYLDFLDFNNEVNL